MSCWAGQPPAFAWQEEGATTALMAAVGMGGRVSRGFAIPGGLEREALTLEAVTIAADLGVEVNARNANGRTAVQAAEGRGYDSVVEFPRSVPTEEGPAR